ncbi:MAG: hypothetical protein EA340_08180 [Nitriliruptor sp.]|nr:MAG: hypothetical protein EA340_08180 [Nitriliruptor sp.]
MSGDESFEGRVRPLLADLPAHHAVTGVAATTAPEDPSDATPVARPEQDDAAVLEHTGRTWDEWRAVIDGWPGHPEGHAAVATWLQDEHGVPGWWAQTVTVGWERLTGRRLPHQMADGTFTANRSATITTDPARLNALLRDEDGRAWLFPGLEPEMRSRPGSKNTRIALVAGVAELAIAPKPGGRATVTVQHSKLPSPAAVVRWKAYWGDWLAAFDEG